MHLQSKSSVYVGIFLRLLKIFPCHSWGLSLGENFWKCMPAWNVLFWEQDRLALGLWRRCLFHALILCIDEFLQNISWLLIMKFINERIYWHETGKNLLNA